MLAMKVALQLLLAACAFAAEWQNWDGLVQDTPKQFLQPMSEAEVVQAVKSSSFIGIAGAGHSFSSIVPTTGTLLQLDHLDTPFGIVPVQPSTWQPGNVTIPASGDALVTFGAGIRVHAANSFLAAHGLALPNTGAIAMQSIAGATSTSTHGTGKDLGSMSTSIEGLRLVLANGTVLDVSNTSHADVFAVARVGLGALGVVVRVTVRAVPLFKLRRVATPYSAVELLPWVYPEAYTKFSRMQWYLTPRTDQATLLLREPVPWDTPIVDCWNDSLAETRWVDPWREDVGARELKGEVEAVAVSSSPEGPTPVVPPRGARKSAHRGAGDAPGQPPSPTGPSVVCTDLSFKALAHQTDDYDLYEEMEIFLPIEQAHDAMVSFLEFENSTALPPNSPQQWAEYSLFTGMRYVKGDDIPLSMMHERDTGVISFITIGNHTVVGPPTAFAHFARHLESTSGAESRFHWGKMNWATVTDVRQGWGDAALDTFLALREELDPNGVFLNDYLRQRLGL